VKLVFIPFCSWKRLRPFQQMGKWEMYDEYEGSEIPLPGAWPFAKYVFWYNNQSQFVSVSIAVTAEVKLITVWTLGWETNSPD
jgi:hypothetical protein